MRVRCVTNDPRTIVERTVRARLLAAYNIDGGDPSLRVSAEYTVQALERWTDGGIRIYLETGGGQLPVPYPLELFEITRSELPQSWHVAVASSDAGTDLSRISFREWVVDGAYYEKLVDGDSAALSSYSENRQIP